MNASIRSYVASKIGIKKEDFKYFGGSFKTYDEFCAFQEQKIAILTKKEIKAIYNMIESIDSVGIRHIDFTEPRDQLLFDGFYFHENGRLVSFSRP